MTLGMEVQENDDVQLTEQNFRHVCRLCLHADEDFIDVFDGIDRNPSKQPLADRVYDLYQIKVNILNLSEIFNHFIFYRNKIITFFFQNYFS